MANVITEWPELTDNFPGTIQNQCRLNDDDDDADVFGASERHSMSECCTNKGGELGTDRLFTLHNLGHKLYVPTRNTGSGVRRQQIAT